MSQRMHIVTVEFTIVLDGVPLIAELDGLVEAIQDGAYEHPAHPDGSFRIVSVGPEEDHRDLDPCFTSITSDEIPGWPVGYGLTDWQHEVGNGDTKLGYTDWRKAQIEQVYDQTTFRPDADQQFDEADVMREWL